MRSSDTEPSWPLPRTQTLNSFTTLKLEETAALPESVTSYINENAKRDGVPAPQPRHDLFKAGVLDSSLWFDLVAVLEDAEVEILVKGLWVHRR